MRVATDPTDCNPLRGRWPRRSDRQQPRQGGRVRGTVAVVALVAVTTIGLAPSAGAKLRRDEVPVLRELLTGIFDRPATSATVACVSARLPAGTIDELLIDGSFGDESDFANSIAFRRLFRHLFACKPTELVTSLAAEFEDIGLTARQRNCLARTFLGRIGTDDVLLTVMIRTGVNGGGFGAVGDTERAVLAVAFAGGLRSCLPRSLANAAIDSLVDELLS
jgi:hypothetical protein